MDKLAWQEEGDPVLAMHCLLPNALKPRVPKQSKESRTVCLLLLLKFTSESFISLISLPIISQQKLSVLSYKPNPKMLWSLALLDNSLFLKPFPFVELIRFTFGFTLCYTTFILLRGAVKAFWHCQAAGGCWKLLGLVTSYFLFGLTHTSLPLQLGKSLAPCLNSYSSILHKTANYHKHYSIWEYCRYFVSYCTFPLHPDNRDHS